MANTPTATDTLDPRQLLTALRSVRKGDFTVRLPLDQTGIAGEIAEAFNDVVELNQRMAKEFERTSAVVGREGRISQRASLGSVTGSWAGCVDSVNTLITDLTQPTAEVSRVLGAVAKGDLSQRMALEMDGRPLKGEFLKSSKIVNTMVDQLNSFASEVTRVAREVGSEGKLGGQAQVPGVVGTWKDLTDSVNSMAGNLTAQVRNIADVTTAVANGDLSKKITVDVKGEILELKNTINTMVDQLNGFASEVTRVAREVGSEGKLGGQAEVRGVAGTWKDLTDSVNSMAGNLTAQVRNIADVTTAVANGDLSKKITVDVRGEILELKDTINTMVDQLNGFASEVTRVAREVGTEGKLGGQAQVRGVAGTWKDLTDNVNSMAGNLTAQVRNIADVTTAVANGDLSKKITVDVKGEILELKNTINTMVDQLNGFASEVTRVAQEVGTEGKLGGQAQVKGVAGTWKDLTDSVNSMAGNLTAQVRNIAEVTTAVANGDLSKKITVDVRGEILELKDTINRMVDQLNGFASEVTRVAREVGSEGKLGGQAQVRGVAGTWKDLTDNVNSMAGNLTWQVRNIAEVTTAVANGDLSKKITVDVRGEILELKDTINRMVDQLNGFASEVTRVAKEVGTEGKLGGQAEVRGVAGTWKDLTDSVNSMAGNLTAQVRNIAEVTTAVANGDLSKKITVDVRGEILELKDTINRMVDQLSTFASEVTRVAKEVGTEGKLGGQAQVRGVAGTWKDLTDNVNAMASNLTVQLRDVSKVATAIANGDLTQKITVDVKGEILQIKDVINKMVDQLNAFASEVTRVAREVGSEGKLGGQAQVRGVAGTWKDLTDSVNSMAGNLTEQVRGIAKVVTAVANGDLKRKLTVEAKGEIAALAETFNGMIDTLDIFADQVTSVAREVGIEGKLGGQASVPGAAGRWRDLTDNVNQLAANLTTQVRAIGQVATAVTKGDLSRSIKVEAQGEVELLKDNINEMIRNLRDTIQKNTEQDWLKTNLARFTGMLQGQKDLQIVAKMILSELAPLINARQGIFYLNLPIEGETMLKLLASYAYRERKHLAQQFRVGEGLVGQCAYEKVRILLTEVPPDYIEISSGLGAAPPLNIVVLPVLFEGDIKAVIELASFNRFSDTHLLFLDQLTESIGIVLNTIAANMRTEMLLQQSQALTQELQSQQEELQQTNEELEEKARLLSAQNEEVERRRKEIDEARRALEQKAEQLALTSKYKSQFMANMSHELRTPLNSMLILARQLGENRDKNLTQKQMEFAEMIYEGGNDLLTLINDILDLSKIESGTTVVEATDVTFGEIQDFIERTFRQVAKDKGLEFSIDHDKTLPRFIYTDPTRLQQVLKNLLSNAFKFTEKGRVGLRIAVANGGWSPDNEILNRAWTVVSFSVRDTGIGIPVDKQDIIFEPFQQADMTTSRKFGGTGLGLSISREIAHLLGGEIRLLSSPEQGSTFTLYLPLTYEPPSSGSRRGDISSSAVSRGNGSRASALRSTRSLDESRLFARSAFPVAVNDEQPIHQGSGRQELEEAFSSSAKRTIAVADLATNPNLSKNEALDDRATLQPNDRVLLIVEDDINFARILLNTARERGFKGLVALNGEMGMSLAQRYRPDAITLDMQLPDMEGWKVLDILKHDLNTRHIPVHVITGGGQWQRALEVGAFAHLTKPVTREDLTGAFDKLLGFIDRKLKNLLVVEDDEVQRNAIVELIGNGDVKTTAVSTGTAAIAALENAEYDCVVTDLGLPDMTGIELIQRINANPQRRKIPIIIYTGKDLSRKEEAELRRLSETIIIKDAKSPERLLDETALFLHRVEANLPEQKRRMLQEIQKTDSVLEGKKVLIVDDDIRNIFALSSVLEGYKMEVAYAENGKEAIEQLRSRPDINIVLMDIMMPEMDGLETMRLIRELPEFVSLPIIAVTAKAMKSDREKCLEAGASDFITKPVNIDQFLSLLRVWLYQ